MLAAVVQPARAGTDDYPTVWKDALQNTLTDTWNEYNRECTSFAAWRLHSRNGFEMRWNDNAIGWSVDASNTHFTVNSVAALGAIAWFSIGHVAWVESINGSNVTVEEYNFSVAFGYDERTVPANSVSKFIHFKDISSQSQQAQPGQQFAGDPAPIPSFVECYARVGSAWIGQPTDAGAGLYVHAYALSGGTGQVQDFNGGSGSRGSIFKHDTVGTAYHIQGEFFNEFQSTHDASGFPFGDRITITSSTYGSTGAWQRFENGAMYSLAPANNARTVCGGIYNEYSGSGTTSGALGFPVADEAVSTTSPFNTLGDVQRFEGGSIFASGRGVFTVSGVIATSYSSAGESSGTYGFPTSELLSDGSGTYQTFEGGTIRATQFMRASTDGTVSLVTSGTRRAFNSAACFFDWGGTFAGIQVVARPTIDAITWDEPIPHLINPNNATTVYWVEDGYSRPIADWPTFLAMGFRQSDIRLNLDPSYVASYPAGPTISAVEPRLIVMDGPNLPAQPLIYVGNPLTVSFTVRNITVDTVTVADLVLSVGGPDGKSYDFPDTGPITLGQNDEYTYTATRSLPVAGTYTFNEAFENTQGNWYQAVNSGYKADVPSSLTVLPIPAVASVSFSPAVANGGDTVMCTVTLVGSTPNDLPIALSTSDTSAVSIPSQTTVYAGQTAATFSVITNRLTTLRAPTVTASNSLGSAQATLTLNVPNVTVSGTITIPECLDLPQPIWFEFRPADGSASFFRFASINPGGSFSFTDIPFNNYTIGVKGSKWLRNDVTANATSGNVLGLSPVLIPGDIHEDNVIDISDFSDLAAAFGSAAGAPNWNANADLNGDGVVDITDFSILVENFGASGDP